MKKIILLAVFFAACCEAHAQESYPRFEIFGGYSYFNSDQFIERESLHVPGFTASVAGNVNHYFGVAAEISGQYGEATIPGIRLNPQFDVNTYTFLFGPRLTHRKGGANFFGHVLFGAARTKVETFDSETDFAFAVGGGVDINVSKRLGVRLIQFDYLPIRGEDDTSHNFRAQVGFVFRLGIE
ncbi:MAG: porin family protein [Acidobacteriota bacterium]